MSMPNPHKWISLDNMALLILCCVCTDNHTCTVVLVRAVVPGRGRVWGRLSGGWVSGVAVGKHTSLEKATHTESGWLAGYKVTVRKEVLTSLDSHMAL